MTTTPAPAASPVEATPCVQPALRRQRDYRNWWCADTSALLAGSVYGFAIPLLLLAVTGSAAQAGALAAIGSLARIGLLLLGGSLADRGNRARLIMLGGLIAATLTASLALISWIGTLSATILCLGHVLLELRGGLFSSSTDAALKDVVHPTQLGRAMAANQGRDAVLSLGGAPLGGLLMALGAAPTLAFIACFQLLTAFFGRKLAPALARAERQAAAEPDYQPSAQGIVSGIRWCFARPQLRTILWLMVAVNLGTNGVMTALVYGLRERGESTISIGLVTASLGVGLLLGSFAAGWLIDRVRTGVLACLSLSTLSLCLLLLAAGEQLWWLGLMLAAAFLSVPALNAAIGGYFMALVPRDLMGRANSVMMLMAMLALPVGLVSAGAGIQLLGLAPTVTLFALLTTLAALAAWGSSHIRSIPHPADWSAAAATPSPTASASAAKRKLRWDLAQSARQRLEPHSQSIYL